MKARAEQGYILVPAIFMLALLALTAYLINTDSAANLNLGKQQATGQRANYIAEAGLAHAAWLANQSACADYRLADTPFQGGSYSATFSPGAGSPIAVTASVAMANGLTRERTRAGVKVYDHIAPRTRILQPGSEGKDTFINADATNENNGNDVELQTSSESDAEVRTLLQFDLSGLPANAHVQTARLELQLQSHGTTDTVTAHALIRDWTESSATWDKRNWINRWDTPGGDFDPDSAGSLLANGTGPKSMHITAVAQQWVSGARPNYGLLLRSSPSASGEENIYHSSESGGGAHPRLFITYVCECGVMCTGVAGGDSVVLSTQSAARLGSLDFQPNDLANYDPTLGTAALIFDGDLASLAADIDAVHVLDNGHIVLSTRRDATLAGLSFEDADLVEYDPQARTATLYFDGSEHFAGSYEDIISLHILNNGNLIVSTASPATLGGLSFSDNDLVEYNPDSKHAKIYFDGDATTLSADISAVHVLENGHIVMATAGNTALGGLSFTPADLIEYNPKTAVAALYFDGSSAFAEPGESIRSAHILGDSGPPVVVKSYKDQFKTQNYAGNDGNLSWGTDWLEVGEDDGPTAGDEQILTGAESNVLRISDSDNGGEGVQRAADLSHCSKAVLNFDYRRSDFDDSNDFVTLAISTDGGTTWAQLGRVQGPANDTATQSASHDISAFMSAATRIRFLTSPALDASDALLMEKVEIACSVVL